MHRLAHTIPVRMTSTTTCCGAVAVFGQLVNTGAKASRTVALSTAIQDVVRADCEASSRYDATSVTAAALSFALACGDGGVVKSRDGRLVATDTALQWTAHAQAAS